MSKANTEVKWFHSTMPNGPVLRGQAGSLIALLDACLIDGFDSRSINTLIVADGIATATISGGHSFEQHAVVVIAGATPASLNDEWRVATVTATTLTFACPDIADTSATGTIVVKRAPVGWGKVFSDTNKAAYQPQSLTSTQMVLRVDDAHAQYARVRGYEAMTGIDAGSAPFPTVAQQAESMFTWAKSDAASSAVRKWILVADGAFLHFAPLFATAYTAFASYRFGDLASFVAGDLFHCHIAAHNTSAPSSASQGISTAVLVRQQQGLYLARAASQIGSAVAAQHVCIVDRAGEAGPLPSGDLLFAEMMLQEGTVNGPLRGGVPGVRLAITKALTARADFAVEHDDSTGRALLVVRVGTNTFSGGDKEFMALDISGPWS